MGHVFCSGIETIADLDTRGESGSLCLLVLRLAPHPGAGAGSWL